MEYSLANSIVLDSVSDWQREVSEWVRGRFGSSSLFDLEERTKRVLEEAFELAQADEMGTVAAVMVMQHVYRRPRGDLKQEAAGLVLTLFALATAHGFDLLAETRKEIDRVLSVPIEVSRERQTFKAEAGIGRRPSPDPDNQDASRATERLDQNSPHEQEQQEQI